MKKNVNYTLLNLKETLKNPTVGYCLQYLYGIGFYRLRLLCSLSGISHNLRLNKLSPVKFKYLLNLVNSSLIGGRGLNQLIDSSILHSQKIGLYRGLRKKDGLPIRGQRTHSNARTSKKLFRN